MLSTTVYGQSTFSEIVTVLENNGCGNVYCHGASSSGFSMAGTELDIYNSIVGVTPHNETAMLKGDKLIDPGYPERSFLYRKINQDLYADSKLHSGENDMMPPNGKLSERDRELIRQWIYFGAPYEGKAFSDEVKEAFTTFHNEGGVGVGEAPPAPPEGEGFQVHLGPFFLKPGEEVEFLKKYDLKLEEGLEVNRISSFLHPFSHHFILYKYRNKVYSDAAKEGMRTVSLSGENPFGNTTELVAVWQDDRDYTLPEGTAFRWSEDDVLEMNYHILNYSTTNVLAADVYYNVYTQPTGTAEKEMFSGLLVNPGIFIPNNGEETYHSQVVGFDYPINVWTVSSHTHKYGKDYDVYLADESGNKGVQLFEGKFNNDYTEYTGIYDYAHPPLRALDKLLRLPANQKMVHEATYINDGPENVNFGLTTDDEMMLFAIQYTVGNDHQELAEFNELPTTICVTDEPLELLKNYETGAIGNGVVGNLFYPDLAGIGSHIILVNCCKENEMREFVVEVTPFTDLDLSFSIDNNSNPPTLSLDPITNITDAFTIQWYLNGVAIPDSNTDLIVAAESGDYAVEIIIENECPAQSEQVAVEMFSGINEINAIALNVSPNPFKDQMTVSYVLENSADVFLKVIDIQGKEIEYVLMENQSAGSNATNLLLDVNPGMYFVSIIADGKILGMEKVMKL